MNSSAWQGGWTGVNPNSLNYLGNVVGVDIVRGAGFNTAKVDLALTYQQIQCDMSFFINKFLETIFFEKSFATGDRAKWVEDTDGPKPQQRISIPLDIILLSGYDMNISFLEMTSPKAVEDVLKDFR